VTDCAVVEVPDAVFGEAIAAFVERFEGTSPTPAWEVRHWLNEILPDHRRYLTFRPLPVDGVLWYYKLQERGWIEPHWPKEFFGRSSHESRKTPHRYRICH
jgi:acyl-CoA synthetase (AMP-forming)/AMP-acid ligase II